MESGTVLLYGLNARGAVCVGEKAAVLRSAEIITALRECSTYGELWQVAERYPEELAGLLEDLAYDRPDGAERLSEGAAASHWAVGSDTFALDDLSPEEQQYLCEHLGASVQDFFTTPVAGLWIPGERVDEVGALLAKWGYLPERDDEIWTRTNWYEP